MDERDEVLMKRAIYARGWFEGAYAATTGKNLEQLKRDAEQCAREEYPMERRLREVKRGDWTFRADPRGLPIGMDEGPVVQFTDIDGRSVWFDGTDIDTMRSLLQAPYEGNE